MTTDVFLRDRAIPSLKRVSFYGKVGLFLVLMLAIVTSMVLHLKGANMDASIAQWTTKPLMLFAAMAVIGDLARSLVRTHLNHSADQEVKR